MRSRAGTAVLVVLGLLMGACADDGEPTVAEEPKPVSGDAGGTTTTTAAAAIDVSTIPANIDEAYINAVLKALRTVEGEGIKVILRTGKLDPEATKHLGAVYGEDELQDQIEVWLREINEGLQGFKDNPAPPQSTVIRTLSASAQCIFLEVQDDVSGYVASPGPFTKQFLQLVPLDRSSGRARYNPTAWVIHQAGLKADGSDPGDLCADS